MFVELLKKHKTFIVYLFWGGVATLVNIGTFMLWLKLDWNYQIGNVVAWFLAVLVTYISNKFFVFNSPFHNVSLFLREMFSFFIIRLLALLLDLIIIWVGMTLLKYNSFLVKVFDNVVVGIVNYIFSRWFIFVDHSNGKQ